SLFGANAAEYTQAAIDQGMADTAAGNTYWGAVGTAMLAAYWAYIGYAAASFVAGEVKEAHKSLPKAMFTSGLVIIGIYMTISTLMARAAMMAGKVGDFSLMSAIGYLNFGGGSFADAGLNSIGGWMPVIGAISAAIAPPGFMIECMNSPKYIPLFPKRSASAAQPNIATSDTKIIAFTGECHFSLTFANLSGKTLSKAIANII
ncbi:unnamed protein product, partial [marine sediment metagenome]